MKLALVGATGLVGSVMIKVLEEFNIPISEFIPVASSKSIGNSITFRGKIYQIVSMDNAILAKPDIALFSAGGDTSLKWAPKFADAGSFVIDNSSAWRMDDSKKLVVPEINGNELTLSDKIIANPNCSTIQMVLAINPLHKKYRINRLIVSTYQSFTGTGVKAVDQYNAEKEGTRVQSSLMAYPHPIFANAIPHCDVFLDNGYTKEEMKLVKETRKILNAPDLRVTATAVRIPVFGGHSESINIEFVNDFELIEVRNLLADSSGIVIEDDIENNIYPMPLNAHNKNEVFVGRIRRDESNPNSLNMWVVSDNLRKGAATNAVQIIIKLMELGLVNSSSI